MSVQVRRRREAASFLSTFVGAQGELLVDTTNNRVQVHDGTTPGGWPAARIGDLSGRNAAVNGSFAVNQRAYVSGTALAAGAYAHDRWKAGPGGCTYSFTQAVPDTALTLTAGTLIQAVDAPNVYATTYWLTWTGTANARVWQGSASGSFAAGSQATVGGVSVNTLLVSGLAVGAVANLEFGTGTLGLVQFEAALPNAGPTRYERRHNETVLCQRYYEVFGCGMIGVATSSSVFGAAVPFKVVKRVTPTILIAATQLAIDQIGVRQVTNTAPSLNIYAVTTGGIGDCGLGGFSGLASGAIHSLVVDALAASAEI